jgi:hypothetical protein
MPQFRAQTPPLPTNVCRQEINYSWSYLKVTYLSAAVAGRRSNRGAAPSPGPPHVKIGTRELGGRGGERGSPVTVTCAARIFYALTYQQAETPYDITGGYRRFGGNCRHRIFKFSPKHS